MRASKYCKERIIGFLRQVEAGMPLKEIGRKCGFRDEFFTNDAPSAQAWMPAKPNAQLAAVAQWRLGSCQ